MIFEFLGTKVTCILNTAWGTSAGIRQRLLEPTESQFYRHDWKALWSTKSNNDQESDGRHKLAAPCKFVWFVAMSLRFANHLHSCQSWITETYISCLNRLIIYLAMYLKVYQYFWSIVTCTSSPWYATTSPRRITVETDINVLSAVE